MTRYVMGVDAGGTKAEVCLLSLHPQLNRFSATGIQDPYQILFRERISTERIGSLVEFFSRFTPLFQKALKSHSLSLTDIESIGFGLPGSIDPIHQRMMQGNIAYFKNHDLPTVFRAALSDTAGKQNYQGPILFDNDANCFALAETYFGAGKTWAQKNGIAISQLCLVGVTLGTGVGGGLIVNGQLIRGRRGGAGEIGHVTLVDSGRLCYCGKFGCSEQYLSGTALEYFYSARASTLEHLSSAEIFKRAQEGDPLAIATIEYYRDHLVTFLSNLSNFLDPHLIVLGGGLSNQPRIYPGISERLSSGCFLTENPPAVLQNQCGDSAGVLGAALLPLFLNQKGEIYS